MKRNKNEQQHIYECEVSTTKFFLVNPDKLTSIILKSPTLFKYTLVVNKIKY